MVAKNVICKECGADVREGSFFCYNCGKSVDADADPSDDNKQANDLTKLEDAAAAAEVSTSYASPKKMRSAMDIARRRASSRAPVKIEWTPRDDSAGMFVIVSIMIAALALVLVILALYLR